jgi:hypothetical protein
MKMSKKMILIACCAALCPALFAKSVNSKEDTNSQSLRPNQSKFAADKQVMLEMPGSSARGFIHDFTQKSKQAVKKLHAIKAEKEYQSGYATSAYKENIHHKENTQLNHLNDFQRRPKLHVHVIAVGSSGSTRVLAYNTCGSKGFKQMLEISPVLPSGYRKEAIKAVQIHIAPVKDLSEAVELGVHTVHEYKYTGLNPTTVISSSSYAARKLAPKQNLLTQKSN